MGRVAVKELFKLIFIILTVLFALVTMLAAFTPYCDPRHFIFMPLLGLIVPALIGACLLLAVYWALRRQWFVSLFVLAAIVVNFNNVLGTYQLPFGQCSSRAENQPVIRVMSYNVAEFTYLKGQNTIFDIARFTKEQNIDIACLQEYNYFHHIHRNDSLLDEFRFLPYKAIVDYTGRRLHTAVFSKYPIIRSGQIIFENTGNTAMYADVDINGRIARIFSGHLQTTSVNQARHKKPSRREAISSPGLKKNYLQHLIAGMSENFSVRAEQADIVRSIIDTTTYDVIVGADLNDLPHSYASQTVKGDLKDGFRTCGKSYGYTFNGFFRLLRIDYVFYSKAFRGVGYNSPKLPWSDHNPVIVDLVYR